jgi:transcription initiation factor IIE alpha subunit
MGIRFRCGHCNQKYELPEEFAGKDAECSKCNETMHIPQKSTLKDSRNTDNTTYDIEPKKLTAANLKILTPSTQSSKKNVARIAAKKVKKVKKTAKKYVPDFLNVKAAKPINDLKSKNDETITFWCKNCGQKYRLSRLLSGKVAECSKCEHILPIPRQSEAVPPSAPPQINVHPLDDPLTTMEDIRTRPIFSKFRKKQKIKSFFTSFTK